MTEDEIRVYERWVGRGSAVGVATVVSVQGSAPRPEGSRLLVSSDGGVEGSVSGGCVENDVTLHTQQVIEDGSPRLVSYGITDDDAFAVGLTCGGTIEVFIDRADRILDTADAERRLRLEEELGATATVVEGPEIGMRAVIRSGSGIVAGELPGGIADGVLADAERLMDRERSRTVDYGSTRVFIETIPPPPLLVIFGASDLAQSLSRLAREAGFRVTVADARAAWATDERFPDVDSLVVGWPDAVLGDLALDRRTYVVLLSHDARFEDPVFAAVRDADVRYLGAMGSRRTHRARLDRLRSQGWTEAQLDRIHGPIGIDIGAETAVETAVSIMAEMIQVRYGTGDGLPLRGREGRIHGRRAHADG